MKKTSKEREDQLFKESEEWEQGKRGLESKAVSAEEAAKIDEGLGLQMISIRLPVETINNLKHLAGDEGIGYQPYIRKLLIEHVKYGPKSELEQRVRALETGRKR